MKNKILLTLLVAGINGAAFGQAIVDPELRTALATSPVAQVIVTFNGSGAPQASQLLALQQLGITRGITMQALPIAGIVATAAQVDALAANPDVRSLFINKQLDYENYDDTNLTGVKRLRLDQQITARNNGTPVSGRGIGVLINDSGVDGTHDDIKLGTHLVQNTLGSTNLNSVNAMLPVTYVEGVPNTDNNSGHGTHCAGTVGGNGSRSGGKYEGVAPGASLLGYGSGGALLVLDAIGGFDYALTHQFQYNIRVISNSFGSSGTFNPSDPLNVATKRCYDRNMVVVFAAGNSGPGADTHNPACRLVRNTDGGAGAALAITSPLDHAEYILDRHDKQQMLLSCAAGSEVRQVYWYVNDRFLRAASATERVFFRPPAGVVKISCADDHGRNVDIRLQVQEL